MRIILIETSTALCSTALVEDGAVVASRESVEPRVHAAMTAVYVDEMLRERGLKVSDCDAVCLSKGPGSYTGLRVGSSTAKGLCFGAGIPLIAVSTLEVLLASAFAGGGVFSASLRDPVRENAPKIPPPASAAAFIVPMIDARRLEVYDAVYSAKGELLRETEAEVITPESFSDYPGRILLVGDNVEKCRPVLKDERFCYLQRNPRAADMAHLATDAFLASRFEDLAYFEPYYLKEFIATTPKKLF